MLIGVAQIAGSPPVDPLAITLGSLRFYSQGPCQPVAVHCWCHLELRVLLLMPHPCSPAYSPPPCHPAHAGTVTSSQNFSRVTQCNGFTECYLDWTCGGVRDYLYELETAHAEGRATGGANRPFNAVPPVPVVPPVGMRSAVPLGGLGTGTFELRADGTFADWQVENQGPALATNKVQNSKLPLKDDALLAIRVHGNGADTFVAPFRTDPPAGVAPAASSLRYAGAYPFSRLAMVDNKLPVTVRLRCHDGMQPPRPAPFASLESI